MKKFVSFSALILLVVYLCGCDSTAKRTVPQTRTAPAEKRAGNSEINTLSLTAVPWMDGEMLRLKLASLQGDEIGTMIYTARRDIKNGEDIWRVISQSYISSSDSQQYAAVEAEAESFRPIFSHAVNLLGNFTTEYSDKRIKLQSTGARGEFQKDVDVDTVVYDNEQLVYLVRRMPLRDDFKASLTLFSATSGAVADCSVAVAGKERVEVAAGTFDSYRVNLSMRSGEEEPREHSMWISADEHRYLTKYLAGLTMILELVETATAEKDMPLTFEDDELGYSFAVPYDWSFYKYKVMAGSFVELLVPELKAKGALCVLDVPAGSKAADVARGDVEKLKKLFPGYMVRGDEFREVSVGCLKAVQYMADLFEEANAASKYPKPKEMVEYRTYITSDKKVYFFVFRAEKDKFDSVRSEFDAIIQSFELEETAQVPEPNSVIVTE